MADTSSSGPQRLSKSDTRVALRNFNVSLVLRGIYDSTCGGNTIVFASFALALGIAPENMGFVATAIGAAIILQILVLPVLGRLRDKKRFVLRLGVFEPVVLVVVVLAMPLLPASWRFPCFVGAMFLGASAANLVRPLSDEWLASTIPTRIRGTYTGLRLQLGAATFAVATLILGSLVGWIGKDNTTGLAWLLAVGAVAGILAIHYLRANTMPAVSSAAVVRRADLLGMVRNRPFRRLALAYVLFDVPFLFAVPYYQVYHLEVIKLAPMWIAVMLAGYQLAKIALLGTAGRLVDRYGARRTLMIVSPAYVGFFACMAVAQPDRPWPLFIAWALAGVGDSVFSVATITSLYAALPDNPSRSAYFAAYNLITVGLYAVGGSIAVPILNALSDTTWHVAGQAYGSFHIFFLAAAAVMIPCTQAALLLPGKRAAL